MKILFLGDILGRSGRDAVLQEMPRLRKELALAYAAAGEPGKKGKHGGGGPPFGKARGHDHDDED